MFNSQEKMLGIDQSHAWYRQISLWPIISNKYKYILSSDFTQQIMLMFDLSFGCSCSVCYSRGHKRLYCKAISSSTAQVPHWQFPLSPLSSQYSSLWSEMFPFSALIYLLSAYSLCLIEVFHFYLTTSTMPSPKKIYSLSQFVRNYPFWIFCLFKTFLSTWRVQHHFSACTITCLYYSWAFWQELQGDWPCTAFHRRWYSPSLHEVRWGLVPPQKHGHPPPQAVLRTQHLPCNLSKPTQERGAQRGYTHIIFLVSENEISVVMKFFRLNCPKLSHWLLCCWTCRGQGLMHITQKSLLSSDSPQPKPECINTQKSHTASFINPFMKIFLSPVGFLLILHLPFFFKHACIQVI